MTFVISFAVIFLFIGVQLAIISVVQAHDSDWQDRQLDKEEIS